MAFKERSDKKLSTKPLSLNYEDVLEAEQQTELPLTGFGGMSL